VQRQAGQASQQQAERGEDRPDPGTGGATAKRIAAMMASICGLPARRTVLPGDKVSFPPTAGLHIA
jgi:hypothetical protein